MKEALFYKKMPEKKVKCHLCARRCLIIEGNTGFCKVRKNIKGKLYSLVYGKVAAMNIDPIEKKPFFHFAPGSHNFSFSTVGCPFRCKFCCNYPLSIEWDKIHGNDMTPAQIVKTAKENHTQGIAYTYVEPTIFAEYAIDAAKIAKKQKLYNVFVTDGYATPESAKVISKHINAAVVDFKCSGHAPSYKKLSLVPSVEPIFQATETYKKNKVFLEISNVLIPGHGDKPSEIKKLAKWVVENIGPETPFHLIRFYPTYKITDIPSTPIKLLEKAYNIAKKEGLKYIYIGNVPNHKYEHTYCPSCNSLVIERGNFTRILLKKDLKCPKCGEKIPISGKSWIPKNSWKA
jgi:pyruvate formate lyase activating enzyme